jgi:hypothetical protein
LGNRPSAAASCSTSWNYSSRSCGVGAAVLPCCGGRIVKLGEDITETLEVVPRQWKVIQTVREKFTCRSCE